MIARLLSSLAIFLALAWALPAMAQQGALEVSVARVAADDGHVFEVSASGAVLASPAEVWKILTDYDRMAEFVPDLHASRVLARSGNRAIVEQVGVARLLFMRRDVHLVVQVNEQPMSLIEVSLVTGDMDVYECRWELVPVPETGGTRIVYSGRMMPKFYVPALFGTRGMRADIHRMLAAVMARLERPSQDGVRTSGTSGAS